MAAGSIVIDLLMKTGSFETDTKRAEKRLRDMEKTAKQWGAGIATAAVAAGTAIAAWTVRMAEAAEEVERFATLSNASTEAFQKWTYGAKTVGIEQEKLADILKDVQDRVGDFLTTGGGPMKDFFEQIAPKVGVTIDQFRRLSGPEALELFVSSLQKANLTQSEMIFQMEAMASDSSLLIPLLKDNAYEMGRLGDEAERLGAVLDEQTIAAASDFHRNLDQLQTVAAGAANEIVSKLIPSLNSVTEKFLAATRAGNGFFQTMLGMAESAFSSGKAADLFKEQNDLLDRIEKNEAAAAKGGVFSGVYEAGLSNARARLAIVQAQIQALETADNWNKPVVQLPPVTVTGTGGGGGGGSTAPKVARSARTERGPDVLGDFIREQERAFDKYQDFIDRVTGRAETARLTEGAKWLEHAREIGAITSTEYQRGIESLFPVAEEATETMSVFSDQAARNIQDSLGETLRMTLEGDFKGIAKAWGDMIIKMTTEAAGAQLGEILMGKPGGGGGGGMFGMLLTSVIGGFAGGPSTGVGQGVSFSSGPLAGTGVWATGGYTGDGGKFEPAGIVHRGEYVINADATRRLPRSFLDRLNGYANGGLVGGPPPAYGGGARESLTIINQTTGRIDKVEERHISATERALIIQEAVESAWAQPNDPNSKASRTLKRNFKMERVM